MENHKKTNQKQLKQNPKRDGTRHQGSRNILQPSPKVPTTSKETIEKTNEPSERDQWGQEMGPKNPNSIRLVLQNVGGIDVHKQGSVKLAALQEFMMDNTVDIAALTECNAAWKQINPKLWPQEQTKFWWENSHWLLAYNRQDPDAAPYQPGGVGILVVNQLSHRAQRLVIT